MAEEVSPTSEEYLETIYKLEEKTGQARTTDIAKQLNVVLGTVTNTVEDLEKQGLVLHKPYKGVKLTERGRRLALDVVRRHRLAERLLSDVLRVDWSEVHEQACKLEHNIKDFVKPLEKTLGHPKTCPHGNPIPTGFGGIIEEKSEPITNLNPGERGIITKITEEKREMLRYLTSLGLIPGVSVKVQEKAPFNGPVIVKVMDASYALGREVASCIWIRKEA